jgi:regulator of sigma E protease
MGVLGIVTGILFLSIMMIVHELGHYLTGRKLGFDIEEFSIFMGPVLFEWEKNGIKYNIKLLPIGASVRFAGEFDDEPTDTSRSISADSDTEAAVKKEDTSGHFYNRPRWARAIVLVTGPALNLLSGVLAFLIMFSSFGFTIPVIAGTMEDTLAYESGLAAGDRVIRANGDKIRTTLDFSGVDMFLGANDKLTLEVEKADGSNQTIDLTPRTVERYRLGITVEQNLQDGGAVVSTVDATSNGGNPVLKPGDIILAAEAVPYSDSEAFRQTVENSAGKPFTLTVLRDGAETDLTMSATMYEDLVPTGIYFASSDNFGEAVIQSFQWSWSIVKVTVRSIGMMFTGAVRPQDTLSGPVGVVSMIGDVVQQRAPLRETVYQLLWMFALISVSLGFMNLLPIPPLDGNHLILTAIEAIRGKRLSMRTQSVIGFVGFALIIGLALLGLTFDIMRLAGG